MELSRGMVVWAELGPTVGQEQSGHRPVVVISTGRFLSRFRRLVTVVPVTSTDRRWPFHVRVDGPGNRLDRASWAMTEQVRTVDRQRLGHGLGRISPATAAELDVWASDWMVP